MSLRHVVGVSLVFFVIILAGHAGAEITMNYCSISCGDNSALSNHQGQSVNVLAGPPGKRGTPGPRGSRGEKGMKGMQGESCHCPNVEDELETLKISFDNLKRFSLKGWTKASNDRWYRLVRERVTFARARELCQSIGGNLASTGMRNDTVRREVVSLFNFKKVDTIWIGLSDIANEGTWVWDDGSQEVSTNWMSGEPNGGRNENCGHFFVNFQFNDDGCSRTFDYLCETDEI